MYLNRPKRCFVLYIIGKQSADSFKPLFRDYADLCVSKIDYCNVKGIL